MVKRLAILVSILVLTVAASPAQKDARTFDVTAEIIEACSCPLFCGCYFNAEPNDPHGCTFNNVFEFKQGSRAGNVDLSGARVWLSGDLGLEALSKGKAAHAVITFDKKTTPEQREAIGAVIGKIYPVSWDKVETREDEISVWEHKDGVAHAKMASGKGEVKLSQGAWRKGDKPSVIQGLNYFGAQSNDGFVLAKSNHYFHGDSISYDLNDRNGFIIRIHISGELPPVQSASK